MGDAGRAPAGRRPLLKGLPQPMSGEERRRMLEQAMQAIAEQPGLSPELKARGIAPLAAARRRLDGWSD
ncbi:MAG TPA: hypothetical protein VKZ69_10115 [Limnochordales bacterium]|nr:hypothetical protein [Limnochordales bacterium]